jgi:hypothetical protein
LAGIQGVRDRDAAPSRRVPSRPVFTRANYVKAAIFGSIFPDQAFILLFRAQNWGDTAGLPLKYTNIAIIGGGLAGSIAAAMLGRASIPTILIDPHQAYPFDFRVEKISGDEHLGRFYQTGITDSVLRSATHDGENWIARFGCLLDKKPSRQLRHQVRRADRNDPGGLSGRQSVMARSERMMVRSEASS